MKFFKGVAYVLVALLVLLFILNGFVDNIDFKFVKIAFKGAPMEHLCFPIWKRDTPKSTEITLSKATANVADRLGDWHIEGDDGYRGTLLSYKFVADGKITNVERISCSGCGGHTWACPAGPTDKPEPRCGAHTSVDHPQSGDWTAYIATDGAPATTTTYRVSYIETKPVCMF